MALKSTLDIDLDDSKFQRFKELFDKFDAALKKQPEIWQKISKLHQQQAANLDNITKAMGRMAEMQKHRVDNADKEVKHLSMIDRLWTNIGVNSRVLSTNVVTITRDFLRWTGLLTAAGGLLGLGGLWGIDRMARGLAGERTQSRGLGVSVGFQRAFQTNFGPYLGDTTGFLGWVANMQQNLSAQAPAMALLHHGLRGRPGEQVELLDAIRNFAKQNANNLPFLGEKFRSWGLDNISPEQQRSLATMTDKQYNDSRASLLRDQYTLGPSDAVADKWTEFTKQMDRAREKMKATFEDGLVVLQPGLTRLSAAFSDLLGVVLKSDLTKETINLLSTGIETLAKFVGSQEFKDDTKQFLDGIHSLAESLKGFTKDPLGTVEGWAKGQFRTPSQAWQQVKDTFGSLDWLGLRGLKPNKAYAASHFNDYLSRLDQHFNIGQGTLEMVRALEASGNDSVSRKGAKGMFQLMPANAAGIDPRDPVDSANRAAQLIQQLMAAFQGNRSQVLAAYNAGQGTVEAAMAAGGPMWRSYLPPETQAYLKRAEVNLNIMNNTGGSTIAAAAQSVAGQ